MDRILRLCGLAFLGAGSALVAAAFLLPRVVEGMLVARWVMLTGLPLLGAGLVLLRRHWEAPVAGRALAAAALVPLVAGLAAAYLGSQPRLALDQVELTSVALPGFTVSLPPGQAPAAPVRYTVGVHRRQVAGRPGPIEVRWMSAGPMSPDELRRSAEVLVAPAVLKQVLTTELDGAPVFSGSFDTEGGEPGTLGITAVYCRDAGQMVIVATGVEAEAAELVAFHSRLAQTIRCGEAVPRQERGVLVPAFRVAGVGHVAGTQPPTFAGVDGAMYTFHPAIGDASAVFSERPELLAEMVAAMGVTVEADSGQASEHEGRHYLSLVATGGETALRITASVFHCPELGLSFFAQHQGPAEAPAQQAIEVLARAACPADGERPISVRQAFLAACEDGLGLACFQLARGIAGGVLEAGELDAKALSSKACELGVASACPSDVDPRAKGTPKP